MCVIDLVLRSVLCRRRSFPRPHSCTRRRRRRRRGLRCHKVQTGTDTREHVDTFHCLLSGREQVLSATKGSGAGKGFLFCCKDVQTPRDKEAPSCQQRAADYRRLTFTRVREIDRPG